MVGVIVTTEARIGQAQRVSAKSGQFFIVGMTERGDVAKPVTVNSMADVDSLLGSRVTYGTVYDQLKAFFNEGGLLARVARVVGAAATTGQLTISDRAGTPVPTLRFDASSPGAWSSGMTLQIADGTLAGTVRVIVKLSDNVVHDINNLTGPTDVVLALSQSPYVRAVNLGSATEAPNNNPAVTAQTAFPAGDDDRNAVTSADYVNALSQFGPDYEDGCLAIPGQSGTTVWNAIIAHCEENNRIGLLAQPVATTLNTYVTSTAAINSEHVGMFGPHLLVSDEAGGTRTISPEGYVAACRARAHETVGPWRIPAGKIAAARYVQGVETMYSQSDTDLLESAHVSPIRMIQGGVRLYGWSSLAQDQVSWKFLKDRDLLNFMVYESERRLEDYIFDNIDRRGQLLSAINAELTGMCESIRSGGGLFELLNDTTGEQIDPGYKVVTDASVNNTTNLSQNEVHADVFVRLSPAGSMITLRIVKVGTSSGL